ncbi:DISARM system-associated protein DrmE [Anoxybacillus flavithermus]|uniref:DISARM system-associated protein DrmE n=1 Tax=Anoxybacillus flavithermus TaxID=33934 RepID=UPI001F504EAA|nr:DISARM system-associated protein DrmE [Anoxybacillus flavithermus]
MQKSISENTVEKFLGFEDTKIRLNMFEQKILTNLKDIILNKANIVFCYPKQCFFWILVLHTVLQDYLQNYKYRDDFAKRISVLVITDKNKFTKFLNNISVLYREFQYKIFEKHEFFRDKGIFCDLNDSYYAQCNWNHILNVYYDGKIPENIPINFILPVAVGYFNFKQMNRGERNKIGRKDNKQKPVFYVTDNINILKSIDFEVDYIFIDYTYIRGFVNPALKGVFCYFDTSLDDRFMYLYNKMKFLNFDTNLLSCLPNETITDKTILGNNNYSIQNLIENRNIKNLDVVYIESEFEEEIAKGLDLLNKLSKKKFDPYDLKIAATILYNAIRTPVSATEYDLIAELQVTYEPINELLNELRESQNRYEDDDFEGLLALLEDIFYKKDLDKRSPKLNKIENQVIREVDQDKKVGIVTSNKIISLALKEHISLKLRCSIDDLESKGICFYSKKELLKGSENTDCDCLIMYSAINLEDLRILEMCNYKKAVLFLYKIEIEFLENKLKKLEQTYNHAAELITQYVHSPVSIYRYFYNRMKRFVPKNDIDVEKGLLNNIIDEVINLKIERNTSIRKKRMYKGKNAVKAKLIEFNDGSYMFANAEFLIKVLNRNVKKCESKKLSELSIGDELLIIDDDARQELFELFVNYTDKNEKTTRCYYLIRKWRELYEERFYNNRLDDEQLYKKMKSNGWDKTTKAILKNWRSGYSYGPRDFEDITCLGKVLFIDEFINNAQLYYSAMQHVRNERRKAARILNDYIFATKANREKILSTLEVYNLSIDQLDEVIKVKKIKDIHKKIYYIKPNELGVLFEE